MALKTGQSGEAYGRTHNLGPKYADYCNRHCLETYVNQDDPDFDLIHNLMFGEQPES